jgi:cell division protein FtsB
MDWRTEYCRKLQKLSGKKPLRSKNVKYALFVVLGLVIITGCENSNSNSALTDEMNALKQEKTQLRERVEESEKEVEQLKEQVRVLSGLPGEEKAENLYRVERVKIGRYTNLYEEDEDGRYEKLIVYLQPIDEEGDVVKATGSVDVQLWDLNKEADKALLGEWHVGAGELKKLWFATIITINYRMTWDVSDIISEYKEALTVKVRFTDYLTGRIFEEQKVIKPR